MPPGINGIETIRQMDSQALKNRPHPIMVTAFGREDLIQSANEVGIEITLNKPVTPSLLFDSAIRVLGGESKQTEKHEEQAISPEMLAPIRGARILVVEDNELNQQVALELLGQVGLETELAENGKIGVQKVQQQPFDAVLMDMQMPVMDGVSATREIRKDSRFADLPILAMTANAMEGDREKCVEAGMNDHIAKPIDPEVLFKTLLRWVPHGDRESIDATPQIGPAPVLDESDPIAGLAAIDGLDVEGGLKRVMGKRDFYEKLVKGFATGEEAKTVETVRAQLSEGEREAAERTSHSLKGVAGTIGAGELQQRAQTLESAIREGNGQAEIDSHLSFVQEELSRLITEIQDALGSEVPEDQKNGDPDFDPSTVKNLPELMEVLETEKARVVELSAVLTVNEVEEFATRMKTLGQQYGCPPVEQWGHRLADASGMFDMDGMSEALNKYPELIGRLTVNT